MKDVINHAMIDNYLNEEVTDANLPDSKAVAADTKATVERTAAIKQVLAVLSDNAKAQADLDEAEAVLRRATHQTEIVEIPNPPAKHSMVALVPVVVLVVIVATIVLVAGNV